MTNANMTSKFDVIAYTQGGARWAVASGFPSRESAARALEALLGKQGTKLIYGHIQCDVTYAIEAA